MRNESFSRLTDKLRELFELDKTELDFGIYRVLRHKAELVERFLNKDLEPLVESALGNVAGVDLKAKKAELERKTKELVADGQDPNKSKSIQTLKAELEGATDRGAIEEEVYSQLYTFFSRYYDGGDFMSLRRYKGDTYAIPYNGEEVKLHWANADQYYIKTSEGWSNFTFACDKDRPGAREKMAALEKAGVTGYALEQAKDNAKSRVKFVLVQAEEGKNNEKKKGKRVFALDPERGVEEQGNGDLFIHLTQSFAEKGETTEEEGSKTKKGKAKLTAEGLLAQAILSACPHEWAQELGRPAPTEANPGRTFLEKQLAHYFAKNSFDYFIHKDLEGFLKRELDFYLKSEVLNLDDLTAPAFQVTQAALAKAKAISLVGQQVIRFLAQLENFQKRLWLKKKFVLETHWCITLDHVLGLGQEPGGKPGKNQGELDKALAKTRAGLLEEILGNEAQRLEWVKLFGINRIEGDLTQPGYSEPLSAEFLAANPYLPLDTRFFSPDFTERLLGAIELLEEKTSGLLVHSENFGALNLLQERYREQVQCVYIDPPYNTSGSEILYKNNYKHSSWVSFLFDRVRKSNTFMLEAGIFSIAIDDAEFARLQIMLFEIFGEEKLLANVPIRSKPQGRAVPSGFSPNHEYAVFFANSDYSEVGRMPRDEKKAARYGISDDEGFFAWANLRGTGANSWRKDRPKLFYKIFVDSNGYIFIPEYKWNRQQNIWETSELHDDKHAVLPIDSEGVERVWTLGWERSKREVSALLQAKNISGEWQIYRKYRPNQEGALPGTWWDSPRYSASESGTKVLKELLGTAAIFAYPKSIHTVMDCLRVSGLGGNEEKYVLDFFAGSGTTGHAVINLNREDGGSRKFILVEMGEYFHTVLKPRILKAAYSKDWKDGQPVGREGVSQIVKCLKLESYEDSLNNLVPPQGQDILPFDQDLPNEALAQQYRLGYALDLEFRSRLLNAQAFEDPFAYKMWVGTDSAGAVKETSVDLVETFNYLVGLKVLGRNRIEEDFLVIDGTLPDGKRAAVVWRKIGKTKAERKKAEEKLQAFVAKRYGQDSSYDLIWINGDHHLPDPQHRFRLLEETFLEQMFGEG